MEIKPAPAIPEEVERRMVRIKADIKPAGAGKVFLARARTSMVRTCGTTSEHSRRLLKKAAFSPAQPWRAKTRLAPGKAADESKPEAYPQGRTVRRIRSTMSVRAAEW